jgi:uncharacterized glyoxalase superfamily protein PhnB
MSIKNLSPYITLDGTASDAIALYERVFGATKLNVTRACRCRRCGRFSGPAEPSDSWSPADRAIRVDAQ